MYRQSKSVLTDCDICPDLSRRPVPNTCKLAQLFLYRDEADAHGPYYGGQRPFRLPSLQLRCCPSRSTTFLDRTSSKAWTIKTQNKHQAGIQAPFRSCYN